MHPTKGKDFGPEGKGEGGLDFFCLIRLDNNIGMSIEHRLHKIEESSMVTAREGLDVKVMISGIICWIHTCDCMNKCVRVVNIVCGL